MRLGRLLGPTHLGSKPFQLCLLLCGVLDLVIPDSGLRDAVLGHKLSSILGSQVKLVLNLARRVRPQ